MQKISINDFQERLQSGEKLQLIDVRSPGEFASGHIPQAVNMPLEQVENRLQDLRANEHVVLICQSGNRACMAYENIKDNRDDLLILEGGTTAWVASGKNVIGSSTSTWSLERQVRLGAGILILIGITLGFLVHPGWFGLAGFVGVGLTFAGLTNLCGMAAVLALMPWNKPKSNQNTGVKATQS